MINKLEFKDDEAITLYPDDIKIVNKINEIIDYLNEQEKINSYKVNWAHQDSITTTKRTYMSTKTGAIIDD